VLIYTNKKTKVTIIHFKIKFITLTKLLIIIYYTKIKKAIIILKIKKIIAIDLKKLQFLLIYIIKLYISYCLIYQSIHVCAELQHYKHQHNISFLDFHKLQPFQTHYIIDMKQEY